MAELLIRDLDDAVARHLREEAVRSGRSAEEMARDILMHRLAAAVYGRAAVADLIRARNKGPFSEESWEIIRRDRDSR